jgi:hypothetical protein
VKTSDTFGTRIGRDATEGDWSGEGGGGSSGKREVLDWGGGVGVRRKDWYRLNDIRTAACGRDMEMWVPSQVVFQCQITLRRYGKHDGETPRRTNAQ